MLLIGTNVLFDHLYSHLATVEAGRRVEHGTVLPELKAADMPLGDGVIGEPWVAMVRQLIANGLWEAGH